MAQCRIPARNIVVVICLTALVVYVTYFTSELYLRLSNIRKVERYKKYDQELTELTRSLHKYKSEAKAVGEGVAILQDVLSEMAAAIKKLPQKQNYLPTEPSINLETKRVNPRMSYKLNEDMFMSQNDLNSQNKESKIVEKTGTHNEGSQIINSKHKKANKKKEYIRNDISKHNSQLHNRTVTQMSEKMDRNGMSKFDKFVLDNEVKSEREEISKR